MSAIDRIRMLDPGAHPGHALHALERDWPETNCYADLWIGILGALDLPVEPCLAFLLRCDFEGDQWTFFKPPHGDLERLYGVQVEELALWRSVLDHVVVQHARGRISLVEVDAYYLPDTRGTDYQRQHTKTTIALTAIDAAARTAHYFHNRGFFRLEGDDFDGIFLPPADDARLEPYCELVKLDRVVEAVPASLSATARELARFHLALRPERNPVEAFGTAFGEQLGALGTDLDAYHAYSFTSLRQLGASAELLGAHARWQAQAGMPQAAAEAFAEVSRGAKTLIMKAARMVGRGRPQDMSGNFEAMARAWQRGVDEVAMWTATP